MKECAKTISTTKPGAVLVLNDQGGGVMSVSYDKTSTLRSQTKHHEPVVLVYESHGQDCRYTPLGDTCSTISQKYGTGGGQRADSGEV